ncbi:MAG TPA: hypothetical protein VEW93_06850 [Acidimicrobiales bacterium]|nr:hypothetical protein [Acidimicrobiales bacterium]
MSDLQVLVLSTASSLVVGLVLDRLTRPRAPVLRWLSLVVLLAVGVVVVPVAVEHLTEDRIAAGQTEISSVLDVRTDGDAWESEAWVEEGDIVEFRYRVENAGARANRFVVGINLAPRLDPIEDSVRIYDQSSPQGRRQADAGPEGGGRALFHGGIALASVHRPGGVSYIRFSAKQVPVEGGCGDLTLHTYGIAGLIDAESPSSEDRAVLHVDVADDCP